MGDSNSTEKLGTVRRAGTEFNLWFAIWGWLIGVFVLFITITNFLHGVIGFKLLPLFENSLIGFRFWAHWLLDALVLDWVVGAFESMLRFMLWAAAQIWPQIGVVPIPKFSIPAWYKDIILVCLIVYRSQSRGLIAVDWTRPNPENWDELHQATNAFLEANPFARALRVFWVTTRRPAVFVARLGSGFLRWITGSRLIAGIFYSFLRSLFEALLLTPLFELAYQTWRVAAVERRGVSTDEIGASVFWTYCSLSIALLSSVIFAIWNGYALDYLH